jgi:hypothetical protein
VLWAKAAGGTGDDICTDIAVDNNGNCYVTGLYSGSSIVFGSTTLTSAGSDDLFVAKYDNTGSVVWAKTYGGTGFDHGNGVATDGVGNCYLTGSFQNSINFGATSYTSAGNSDLFIVKLDQAGAVVWAKAEGGKDFDEGFRLALDANMNSYVTGTVSDTFNFGTTPIASAGLNEFLLVKYDPMGNISWVRTAKGGGSENGTALAIDGSGNCYVAGSLYGASTTFGSTTLVSKGAHDFFVAKYGSLGALGWVNSYGGMWDDLCLGIAIDGNSNGYITGWFVSDSLKLDNLQKPNPTPFTGSMYTARFCSTAPPAVTITQAGTALNAPSGFSTYQWFRNGSPVSGATSSGYVPTQSGSYYVVVTTSSNNCSGQSNTISVILAGINEVADNTSFNLSPNPNNGTFTISSILQSANGLVTYEVRDMTGRLIMSNTVRLSSNRFEKQVELRDLSQGIYILRIMTDEETGVRTFVVK